jgi:hypothetical protein
MTIGIFAICLDCHAMHLVKDIPLNKCDHCRLPFTNFCMGSGRESYIGRGPGKWNSSWIFGGSKEFIIKTLENCLENLAEDGYLPPKVWTSTIMEIRDGRIVHVPISNMVDFAYRVKELLEYAQQSKVEFTILSENGPGSSSNDDYAEIVLERAKIIYPELYPPDP